MKMRAGLQDQRANPMRAIGFKQPTPGETIGVLEIVSQLGAVSTWRAERMH